MEGVAAVATIALFDMQFQPDFARAGLDATSAAARDTRAFAGSTGVRVIVDEKDPAHVIVVEQWETESHDAAYQAWRAGDGLPTDIIAMLARPATTTHFTVSLDL
jgi:quinol monooxygenase YgiN